MAGFTHGGAFIVPTRRIGNAPEIPHRTCPHGSPLTMRDRQEVCGPTCPDRRAEEAKKNPKEMVFIQSAVEPTPGIRRYR